MATFKLYYRLVGLFDSWVLVGLSGGWVCEVLTDQLYTWDMHDFGWDVW